MIQKNTIHNIFLLHWQLNLQKQFYIETFFLKLYLCSIHIDKSLNYHNQKARIQWLIESIGPDFHCGVSSYLR